MDQVSCKLILVLLRHLRYLGFDVFQIHAAELSDHAKPARAVLLHSCAQSDQAKGPSYRNRGTRPRFAAAGG